MPGPVHQQQQVQALYQAHTALEDLFVVALDYWVEIQPWVAPYTRSCYDSQHTNTEWLDVSRLKHLRNVETPFDCPQAILSSDFQCRDDVSELK